MRMPKRSWALLLALALLQIAARCDRPAGEGGPSPQEAAPTSQAAVAGGEASPGAILGQLKTRDRLLIIRAGLDGPEYTVAARDGTPLATGLSRSDLVARFPDLAEALDRGRASDGIDMGIH